MKIRTEFTKEEIKKYPELDNPDNIAVLTHLLKRIQSGKNALGLTIGVTGSGKSFVDLRIAELLMVMQGKVFDPSTRVIFGLKDFLIYTNRPDLEPGDVSIPEELGVSMSSRQWQRNVDYSQLLQTFRDLGLICLFNMPFKSMVDKHARLLAHFQIEMQTREGDRNVTKFFVLQHNPSARTESKATYRKYIRTRTENEWGFKKMKPIKKLYWEKPSKEVLDVYLPLQSNFKSMIRQGLEAKARKAEQKENEDKKPVRQHKEDIEKAKKYFEQGLSVNDIAKILHRTPRCIRNYRKEIEMEEKRKEKGGI